MTAPTLIFGWGNPSRGDDALGPRFVELFEQEAVQAPDWGEVAFLTDFQLQIEHALDLRGRCRVLFVDAGANAEPPAELAHLEPRTDATLSSHALSPQALMQVAADLPVAPLPGCWLLTLGGSDFELGAPLSAAAERNLQAGLRLARHWMDERESLD